MWWDTPVVPPTQREEQRTLLAEGQSRLPLSSSLAPATAEDSSGKKKKKKSLELKRLLKATSEGQSPENVPTTLNRVC